MKTSTRLLGKLTKSEFRRCSLCGAHVATYAECYHASVCSPPPKNSAPPVGVALDSSKDGAGVCTCPKKSNLDKGDLNIVRKGVTVDYMGLRCTVQRVRLGMFYGQTLISKSLVNFPCAWVRVVA